VKILGVVAAMLMLAGCGKPAPGLPVYKVVSFENSQPPYAVPYVGCHIVVENKTSRVFAWSYSDCHVHVGEDAHGDMTGFAIFITPTVDVNDEMEFFVTRAEAR